MRDLVIHAPTGLQLDFGQEDFGGPREAAVIAAWARRHSADPGEFICYVHRSHEKPWLYLRQHGQAIVAAHWPGTNLKGTHEITHGVSDEHKRQVEYIERAGQAAGFEVATEVSHATKVRSDAVIYGPVKTGIEVQRSAIADALVKSRTTKARRAGVLPIWFSDAHEKDPSWFGAVPAVRMSMHSWDAVPSPGSIMVVSGVREVAVRRCRDLRDNTCPDRRRGCRQWHVELDPRRGTRVDDLAELVPDGRLVPMEYRAGRGRRHVYLVSRVDKQRYESIAGVSADLPMLPKERLVRAGERTECAADAGAVVEIARPPLPRIVLDWRRNETGPPRACRLCLAPATTRDAEGRPCHKVCAEDAANGQV